MTFVGQGQDFVGQGQEFVGQGHFCVFGLGRRITALADEFLTLADEGASPAKAQNSSATAKAKNSSATAKAKIRRQGQKFVGQGQNSSPRPGSNPQGQNSSAKAIRLGFFPFRVRLGFLLRGPFRVPFRIPFKVSFKVPVVRPQRKFV